MFQKNNEDQENLDILARRSTDKSGEIETWISPATKITGEIEGKENVRLDGSIDGKARTGGLFLIGQSGKFKGEISADSIIVEGEFEGDVKSTKKIELRSTAKFRGNINAAIVAMAEGSFFEGEVKMTNNGQGKQFSFEEKRKIRTEKGTD